MKQVDFTLPAKVSQSVDDFLTANPDVEGAFAGVGPTSARHAFLDTARGIHIP